MSAAEARPSGLDPVLLEVLACPAEHHAPLTWEPAGAEELDALFDGRIDGTLSCTECGRVFPVRDGIPVLILDDARGGPDASGPTGTSAS
jgi:uncharacterized protein YbaR (Trm112 family)